MLSEKEIEDALHTHLPADKPDTISRLARFLARAMNNDLSADEIQSIASKEGLSNEMLERLLGEEITTRSCVIKIDKNNQMGDLKLNDVAGNNIIHLNNFIFQITETNPSQKHHSNEDLIQYNKLNKILISTSIAVIFAFITIETSSLIDNTLPVDLQDYKGTISSISLAFLTFLVIFFLPMPQGKNKNTEISGKKASFQELRIWEKPSIVYKRRQNANEYTIEVQISGRNVISYKRGSGEGEFSILGVAILSNTTTGITVPAISVLAATAGLVIGGAIVDIPGQAHAFMSPSGAPFLDASATLQARLTATSQNTDNVPDTHSTSIPQPTDVIPIPTVRPIPTELGSCGTRVVNTGGGGLNLRDTPNGVIQASIPNNTTITLLCTPKQEVDNNSWVNIRWRYSSEGKTRAGWVIEQYLK